jgi:hypothetical protein
VIVVIESPADEERLSLAEFAREVMQYSDAALRLMDRRNIHLEDRSNINSNCSRDSDHPARLNPGLTSVL